MSGKFILKGDTCTLTDFNTIRPFSSFLPGIAGEYGKPLWVFTTNRGQCIASFGMRDKNGAMLEFYPANKAYAVTPLFGFRTFLKLSGSKRTIYEPFAIAPAPGVQQLLHVRPAEIEIEEIHRSLGLRIRIVTFGVPNESLPVLLRSVTIENIGRKPVSFDLVDGLPQIVPFGLNESLLKTMSRTMEAFVETLHADENLPLFKLKVEPSDRPEMERIQGGFFSFTLAQGHTIPLVVDPRRVFGTDTSFQFPRGLEMGGMMSKPPLTESQFGCAFSVQHVQIAPGGSKSFESYYGHVDQWTLASQYRRKLEKIPTYAFDRRAENTRVVRQVMDQFAIHSALPELDAYTQQSFLDNTLRGGQPMVLAKNGRQQVFHYYSRKHGDMERDYNFFELSPSYFSQGNGNFRDVNQNRRSEVLCFRGVGAANIETFFNLIQLDGFNPLVIQYEKFFIAPEALPQTDDWFDSRDRDEWRQFLAKPFSPGELYEKLLAVLGSTKARGRFEDILLLSQKIQDAVHGEGFWTDHWTYNLDLLENFASVYPDQLQSLWIDRRDFTTFDNEYVVQPRSRKYIRTEDGRIRQGHAVVKDAEKSELIRKRASDPYKVRMEHGTGAMYRTSLLVKVLNLIAVKAASLDPFGVGIEMEAEKPGWCDALNGLPALFGSSVNEAFELQRWVVLVKSLLQEGLSLGSGHAVPEEVAALIQEVQQALANAHFDRFFETWDKLSTAKEHFREITRLGIHGRNVSMSRAEVDTFLATVLQALVVGLEKARVAGDLYATYFTHEIVEFDPLPDTTNAQGKPNSPTVKAKRFKSTPVSPFLEGPVHALRSIDRPESAVKLYKAVRASELYDRPLGMYRLNVPLKKESFEIGRSKIFTPGWLENESIFLHMHYKFLLEILRSGLVDEFYEDMKKGLVVFQDPQRYGRSTLENSSFIASSRFPDPTMHGTGYVSRLSGATAEWVSMVFHMGLGRQPFTFKNGTLSFSPSPVLVDWLFARKAEGDFGKDTFAFKLWGSTWVVYHNPSRQKTYGSGAVKPVRYTLMSIDGSEETIDSAALPDVPSRALRDGRYSRITIELA